MGSWCLKRDPSSPHPRTSVRGFYWGGAATSLSRPRRQLLLVNFASHHVASRGVYVANRRPYGLLERVGLTVKRRIWLAAMLTRRTVVCTGFMQSVRPSEEVAAIRTQPESEFEHTRRHRHYFTSTLVHRSSSTTSQERGCHRKWVVSEGNDRQLELYPLHELPGCVALTTRFFGIHRGPLLGKTGCRGHGLQQAWHAILL